MKSKNVSAVTARLLGIAALLCISGSLAGQQREIAAAAVPAMPSPGLTKVANEAKPQQGQALATQPAPEEHVPETVHMLVGHSLLIHSQSRVKRMLTGNPTVIDAVLTSPTQVVVTAKEPGNSTLLLWDESNQDRTLNVASDVDVESLSAAIQRTFSGSDVEVQADGGKVILVGTVASKEVAEQMAKMAGNFSKEVVNALQVARPPRLKQVLLKVRFAEADRSKINTFGVNLFSLNPSMLGASTTQQFSNNTLGADGIQRPGFGSNQPAFHISDLLNIFLFRPDINLGAVIRDLQEKQVLQILAEPNLMAMSGESAHFLAGGEFPYPVVQGTSSGIGGAVTIQFKPYGVKLEFVGDILEDGSIRLKVTPEVSSLDYTNTVQISGFNLPAISTRRAETVVELKDGQSFGIAGLLDDRTTVQLSRMPGIADIPILGELFKSKSVNRSNTELLVLVTPSVVDMIHGEAPPEPVHVDPPVHNLEKDKFDQHLPNAQKSSGAN